METFLIEGEGAEPVVALKYQDYINSKQLQIPCPNCSTKMNAVVYRFINGTFEWPEQFAPTVISDEIKQYKRPIRDEEDDCVHCSLSLYTSQELAISNYKFTNVKTKAKLNFVAIASGELLETDGIASRPNEQGHFSFYEYAGIDISTKFEIVQKLA